MLNRAINRSANYILSAPIGGLNVRDNTDNMSETDAIVMDNYYPSETNVCLRGGYKIHSLGGTDYKIETLISFCSPSYKRMFATANGCIIDVTSENYSIAVCNQRKNLWHYVQFRNRLLLANGTDSPLTYCQNENEEWIWQETVLDGDDLDKEMLCGVAVSKQRVFYIEKNSQAYWYSEGVGEVQGNLCRVDLSSMLSRGGSLTSIACWTQDGGQGIDDLTVFITSEGEVLVYAGNDPGNADDWVLKGRYCVSRPVGEYCTMQYQGDIILICEDGYVPLSAVLSKAESTTSHEAYSDKIRGLVLSRIKSGQKLSGWQSLIYPRGGYALFNVPLGNQYEQHIVNMSSGAWCRFTGIYAFCWCLFEGRLYFGSQGGVYLFDEGYADNGLPISGTIHQAYCSLGSMNLKKIQMINPRTKSSSNFDLTIYTNTDFNDEDRDCVESMGYIGDSQWDKCRWSSIAEPSGTKWATIQSNICDRWMGNNGIGFKVSVVFKTKTKGSMIEWYNTGLRFEQGGGIV